MKYAITVLVDGEVVSSFKTSFIEELEGRTDLAGPDLWDFTTTLKLTGKAIDVQRDAVDVQRDAVGVTVTIAHEEL